MSRKIFVLEVIFLAAPISLVYLTVGVIFLVLPGLASTAWYERVIALIGLFVLFAVLAAWMLILTFLRAGPEGLRQRGFGWWLVSLMGAALVVISWGSGLFPESAGYSQMWALRLKLEFFVFGLPLLIPLAHLLAERLLRRAL